MKANPKELKEYLSFIVDDYARNKDMEVFLDCLKVAVMANRGLATTIAKTKRIDRSGIYKALSNRTKPRIDTFENILNGLGLGISIVKLKQKAA